MSPAPRNRTLTLTSQDQERLRSQLLTPTTLGEDWPEGIIWAEMEQVCPQLPPAQVDLLILDPPYNLTKSFNHNQFKKQSVADYSQWLEATLQWIKPLLKPTASIYICGDWLTSASIYPVAQSHFQVRNRITWEREKGRGAQRNWKNNSEDIWFCTMSKEFTFNADAVKLRRRVLAPYRKNGQPKDWRTTPVGKVRDTYPSNFWTDITVPFWSMPENTNHPTQKSEKLLAKLILASSNPGDVVLDPFLGSGTTIVVAQKLGRRYLGIERDETYCLLAARRLELAQQDPRIQGWHEQVFWERNTHCAD